MTGPLASVYERFGNTYREFECCDTTFRIQAMGVRAEAGATATRKTAESLEAQLNTFDAASAVNQLNREGEVRNEHVVRIVRRGIEYNDRTGGVFDIHQGRVEQGLKTFLRDDSETLPTEFDTGTDDSHATITFSAPGEEAEDAEAPERTKIPRLTYCSKSCVSGMLQAMDASSVNYSEVDTTKSREQVVKTIGVQPSNPNE
ncbi:MULTISPECIES: FAD:protein FMN transferase [Haloarcula]|uniref:Thiamine biosynthesis protein n=1 Tax=Haloarcula amylolytica JCM 13557 TaxID=1227452 RepID=M0KPF0_9EURY|nr:FAD:protein FMN transferase [Haloarcula amylolytica]EMA23257.1 thiamine biosynthesis protein [Haloarcula amylolytica JCM 13557]